ncbi:hypothetical protein PTKIN_Ptkin10aG0048400 [Pterospermum kingtungense]
MVATVLALKWSQKTVTLPPHRRDCPFLTFSVVGQILKEIRPDLLEFKCGLTHLFFLKCLKFQCQFSREDLRFGSIRLKVCFGKEAKTRDQPSVNARETSDLNRAKSHHGTAKTSSRPQVVAIERTKNRIGVKSDIMVYP